MEIGPRPRNLDTSRKTLVDHFYNKYEVRDLFPAGPISGTFVLKASISCNCNFSSEIDLWSKLWIPPQIFLGEFIYAKLKIVVS